MRRNTFYMKMPEEKVDSNSTFIVDPSGLDNLEKVFSCLLWIIINVPGNLLLFGMIQYEKKGRHPLKKRLTDQVTKISALQLTYIPINSNFVVVVLFHIQSVNCHQYYMFINVCMGRDNISIQL